MKNFLIAFVAGSILALAATTGANAQNSSAIRIDNSVFPVESNAVVSTSSISTKALKDFRKSFKNANGEKWAKNATGFTAQFASNGIANIVYYDAKGNWQASLKTYSEDKLDRNVRAIVKSKYFDDKITQVQEIETTATLDTPTYMVYLEGDNDFKIIRVSDGAMDVYQEFAKQK